MNIDWELFKIQKEYLVMMLAGGMERQADEIATLEGVINLMDFIQDEFETKGPKFTREGYVDQLAAIIQDAMMKDPDMIWEAIVEGRIGLYEMSNSDLVEFGKNCWNMVGEIE